MPAESDGESRGFRLQAADNGPPVHFRLKPEDTRVER
jgi:hypothetical protein